MKIRILYNFDTNTSNDTLNSLFHDLFNFGQKYPKGTVDVEVNEELDYLAINLETGEG